MRIAVVAIVLACAPASASPKASKAANARGMALMGKKKWADAEAEFKQAVAEDPNSIKAHYNLASAASRAHDFETAAWEIAWVGDRAVWNDEAKDAAKKAPNDDDLTWAIKEWGFDSSAWIGDQAGALAEAVDDTGHNIYTGHAAPDAERAKWTKLLAAAPGAHDANCDAADAKQGKVFALPAPLNALEHYTAIASLKDGVALVDPTGKIVARGEPLGCTGPGESQDQLATLVMPLFGDPIAINSSHHPPRAVQAVQMIAVSFNTGGRREWQTTLAVFARRDKTFVKVFEATLASSDASGAGHVVLTPFGNLVYSGPGETKKHGFGWDQGAFKFVALP